MKKFILNVGFAAASLFCGTMYAQPAPYGSCATNSVTGGGGGYYKTYPSACSSVANYIPTSTTDTLTFRVNFHIFKHPNGDPGTMDNLTALDCKNLVKFGLNQFKYEGISNSPSLPTSPPAVNVSPDSRIRFKFTNLYVHYDDHAFFSPSIYDFYFYNTYAVNPKSEINVFILDSTVTGAAGDAIRLGAVNIGHYRNDWLNTSAWPWGPSYLLAHELGHAVGNLQHPCVSEFPGTPYPGSGTAQFPDCSLEQDCGCDVGACSPNPCPTWGWVNSIPDSISDNIMGYNEFRDYLSPDQIANFFMGAAYQNSGVYGSGINTTPFTTYCNWDSSKTINVTSTQTWTTARAIGGDLVVKAGNLLTIQCLVSLPPGGRVIVEPTAKLVLDGGTLTSNCNYMWDGVQVWGNSTANQSLHGSQMPTYQGMLSIINGGTIQNAEYGVSLVSADTNGTVDWSKTGGIVQAVGASFINNNKDVAFWPYTAYSSVSYFKGCTFQLGTRAWSGWSDSRVSLYLVHGVNFLGNTFINTSSYPGYGIGSADAGYSLDNYTVGSTVTHNTFSGFNYGVYAQNSTTTYAVNVFRSVFSNMVSGCVYLGASNYSAIESNTLTINNSNNLATNYGVYLDQCTAYSFFGNTFTGTTTGIYQNEGSYIHASGTGANAAYNNTFNNLSFGQWAAEQNEGSSGATGLLINCNDFNTCTYDIGVQSLTNNSLAGIAKVQGVHNTVAQYARNTYNNSGSCGSQNKIYIYQAQSYGMTHASFTGALYEPTPQPDCSPTLVTVYSDAGTYNKATYCPANPGGGGGGAGRLASAHQHIKRQSTALQMMPQGTVALDAAKQNAQDVLDYTRNQYGLLLNEKIRSLLNDTNNNNPYDSAIYYLRAAEQTPHIHKMLVRMYLQKGDYAMANTYADSTKLAGNTDFATYHKAIITLKQNPNYYASLSNNAVLKNQMLGYANNYNSEMNAAARGFLKQVYGMNFTETILTPVQTGMAQRTTATGETIIELADNVSMYPNPAQNTLNIDYNLSEKESATISITDLNGKLVKSIYLAGGTQKNTSDISDLTNGLYFVTLEKAGAVISVQKLVIVK